MDDEQLFDVFHRNWWKEATRGGWPNNLEPDPHAERHPIAEGVTREEALELCAEYNSTHEPGRYADKAEFEKV